MKLFGWKWLRNLGLVASIIAIPTIGARAQSDLVLLMSAAGDRVGVGQTYYTTNPVDVILSGDATTVSVQAFGFTMIFAGPSNSPLAPGVYSNAVQYPTNGDAPGLSVFGNGRSCTNVCGNFQILELATNTSGRVVRLWATFLQHCECDTTPPLTGEIRYNSQTSTGGPLARILLVPQDFPNIQSALNAVSKMTVDTVLVGPGLYQESVQFGSNSAHVVSAAGPSATFITAPGATAVGFGFEGGYKSGTVDAMLSGFTITNSSAGVSVMGGYSPTIVSNEIVNCGSGLICRPSGIGSPASTIFQSNFVHGCTGWAVELWWTEAPRVEGNRVEGNGSGLLLWSAGTPEIRSNIIRSNAGDGLYMVNTYGVNIVQNLVIGNEGNGLNLLKPGGGMRGPWVYNNTILDNGLAGIATSIFADDADVHNNIVVGDPPLALGAGIFTHNDFYPAPGAVLSGAVTNLIGVDGNISANPFLVCQPGQNFQLLPTSPCIDAGTTGVQIVMASDF